MLKRIAPLLILVLAISTMTMAQVTTSTLTGTVKNASDEPLVGATITAIHQPSGTKYATTSRSGGQFTINNMRVGGPYTIEISFVGFQTDKQEDVYLKLAETQIINSNLKSTSGELTNVVITTAARRNSILNGSRTGTVTNIGITQIQRMPSISRSVNDLTRATPQSNGSSIGGGNFRQNNFTVDGADFNNTFGIGTNLPAGGSPISIDALEEISVSITPYDVRQSNFIGSAINAVTRAGTNKFSGSVYTYFRNEKQRGDQVDKTTFIRPVEQYKLYGARIGGPIIKNKLFFFLNYEKEKQPKTVQTRFAATPSQPYSGSGNIARPTVAELDVISAYLASTYKYATGPYDNYSTEIIREKIMGRLDWNISSKHRFNMRYSQVEGGEPNPPSTSTTGTGNSFPTGSGRTDVNALWFKNSNYFQGANFYSFSAELNSQLGKFSNTLRGTYTFQNDSRESDSQVFPFVDILKDGSPFTSFGYEPFTFGNLRKVKTYSFLDNFSWRTKKHFWTIGAQGDFSTTINGFQRFATSYYRFNSWADFTGGAKPTDFAYTYSLSPGFAQAFPSFKFAQLSFYGQDEIAVNKNFRLTLGLRFDRPSYPDVSEIKTHPLVANLTFANGEKLNTGLLPSNKIMASPRLGFNWDLYGDRSLQIRGGTGIFTGKVPFVWIVSQSGDAGLLQVTQSFNSPATVPGPFNPDPRAYYPATIPPAGTVIPSAISVVSPNFKNPQSWKSSLAFDTKLPAGMIATVEAIFNKDIHTAYFRNANLVAPAALNVAGYPDNRMIYPAPNQQKFVNPLTSAGQPSPAGTSAFNAIVMDNSKKGYYFSLTAKIEKPFSKGFFASIAYTKSMADNLFDGGGDQPLSAWQSVQNVNGSNTPNMGYASYVVPDRVIATFSYRKEYIKHLGTTISLLYQGSADGRFSYVYGGSASGTKSGDLNRDGFIGNDLIYIPKNASEIDFVAMPASSSNNNIAYSAQQQSDLFFAYIEQDKYLRAHKGQYAERNGAQLPWRNQLDVKFMQDLFINLGKDRNTLQFTIDVVNFGNLLNPNWGKVKTINNSSILQPQNTTLLTPGGTVRPTFWLATDRGNIITSTFRDNVSTASTYSIQFGLRYIFN